MQTSLPSQRQPLAPHSHHNWSSKRSNTSWTDQRVDQIKKKYESTKAYASSQLRAKKKSDKNNKENYHQYPKNHNIGFEQQKAPASQGIGITNNVSVSRDTTINAGIEPKISHFRIDLSESNQKSTECDISQSHAAQHYPFSCYSQGKKQPQVKSVRLHTDASNFLRSKQVPHKAPKVNIYDSRMQSIDRINTKIRRILDSIKTCEAEHSKAGNYQDQQTAKYQLGRSVVSGCEDAHDSERDLQETTILEKKQFYYPNDKKAQNGASLTRNYRSSSALNSQHTQHQLYRSRMQQPYLMMAGRANLEQKRDCIRSSSCFSQLKHFQSPPLKNEYASRNKDKIIEIEHQINRFHSKIEQLESQKKKLNIKYTPFEHSPARRVATQHTSDSEGISRNQYGKLDRKTFFNELPSRMSIGTFNDRNQNSISNIKSLKRHNYYQKYDCSAKNIQSVYQEEEEKYPELKNIEQQQTFESYDYAELKSQIEKNMADRRKMLAEQNSSQNCSQKSPSKKLLAALCQQVALDQELRSSKNWFSQLNKRDKLRQLQQQFYSLGVQMDASLLEHQFSISDENETDPFFSFRQEKYNLALVASNYIQADKFWQQFILKKWEAQVILHEEHLFGHNHNKPLSIEDLVRLINTETSNFYRNRDLYLIYDRIKKTAGCRRDTVTLDEVAKVIGK